MIPTLFSASARPNVTGRRTLGATVLAGLFVVGAAGAASAHVHVDATSKAADSSTQLGFRVPSESETASTTTISIALPVDSPFTDVSVQSLPGWTATVESAPLATPVTVDGTQLTKAPRTVTWKANTAADAVAPEQYQYFTLSVGPLPKQGTTLQFPVTQTYSDGSVVTWNQPTPAGGDEPEFPAPELTTTAAMAGGHGDDDDEAMAAMPGMGDAAPASATSGDSADAAARWLGGAGLGLGALALLVAGLRGRRPVEPKA